MIWLKACHRCQGDFLEGVDSYGVYVACLQCGYYLSPEELAALRKGYLVFRQLVQARSLVPSEESEMVAEVA
ncbi:MAG: hypothetical protein HYX89_06600 [Chloroflexi bacterium]|nr:hypothetical protein [Chloroflexota bacterium]